MWGRYPVRMRAALASMVPDAPLAVEVADPSVVE